MQKPSREQRITLRIASTTLPLRVPSTEEASYRNGAEDLNLTLGIYRRRFPLEQEQGDNLHLTMAAIDVAYRCERWRQEAQTRDLIDQIDRLSKQAEELYLKHRYLLESLQLTD